LIGTFHRIPQFNKKTLHLRRVNGYTRKKPIFSELAPLTPNPGENRFLEGLVNVL
jgi:hypothetical protein